MRAEHAKFSKIEGDRRVVRGKVFVCLDVCTFRVVASECNCTVFAVDHNA